MLAVVTQVTQAAQAAPVIQTVVQQVPVTPENVKELLNLLLLVGTGYFASFAHAVLAPSKWHKLNVVALFVYSAVLAVLDLYLSNKLSVHNWSQLGIAFFTILGAASARYNAGKLGVASTEVVKPF